MGLDVNGVRSLLFSRKLGTDFSRTAMIGRQVYYLSPSALTTALESFGYRLGSQDVEQLLTKNDYHIEPILSLLGADLIHSLDYSGYQGATHVHDMNQPVPDSMKGEYSLVIDFGTLEHVFNYPVAIKNCMEMLAVDGTCLLVTPANNFCGHGFYQLSPELFFNVFSPANGFETLEVIVFEDKPFAPWFSVRSPMAAGQRVMLQSGLPTYMLVIARKRAVVEIFCNAPQQSDYVAAWDRWQSNDQSLQSASYQQYKSSQQSSSMPGGSQALQAALKHLAPRAFKNVTRDAVRLINSYVFNPFNPKFYTLIDPTSDR